MICFGRSNASRDLFLHIRTAREAIGLSQRDLSARITVPQSHISKIESGGADLRLSSLVELARALDQWFWCRASFCRRSRLSSGTLRLHFPMTRACAPAC
ncbi:helix-turn-helix transcriptional regulator [Bradyrhizobium sp. 164]|uniref:helix-turn-helix domain-containing protein n=1 Tax=Bradyrhizobium sp. 164 TaxID=2782637 RepID=UPI00320ADB2D